jgi:hypothetical protein
LPVMSVNTNISFMIIFTVGAPHSLEMKEIKVHVRLKFLYQLNW